MGGNRLDPGGLIADASRPQPADHGFKRQVAVFEAVEARQAHAAAVLAIVGEGNAGRGGVGLH
jgi:hypothetical protein